MLKQTKDRLALKSKWVCNLQVKKNWRQKSVLLKETIQGTQAKKDQMKSSMTMSQHQLNLQK